MAEKGRNQRSCRHEYLGSTKHETTVYDDQYSPTSASFVWELDDEQQPRDDQFYEPTVYPKYLPQSLYDSDDVDQQYPEPFLESPPSNDHQVLRLGAQSNAARIPECDHAIKGSKHRQPMKNGPSHGQYVPEDVYAWKSDSGDQDTGQGAAGYVEERDDDEAIQQIYRDMGAVNLDDGVLNFGVDNQLCSEHDANHYPFNFDAELESGRIGRHDIPLPSPPTRSEKKGLSRRDINKGMKVEAWRTILIEFRGTNGYATLLGLKDSGTNVGNMITMAAVEMLGLAHKIDKSHRGEKVNTGGGVVSIKGTIWLEARGNGKHSGALFKVWEPNYNIYHVIMGAEWCYDNDALQKSNGGYNPANKLPAPDMNPIDWVDKESKDEARRNNDNAERLALEAAQAEAARKTRKSSGKGRSKRQPRS